MSAKIRIDKWLWVIRVFKTRSLANDACQAGKVKMNNGRIKPSKIIQIGDRITVQKGFIKFDYEVKGIIEKRASATIAQQNYLDHTPKKELIKQKSNLFSAHYHREKGQGRPTKKDRRDLDKLLGKSGD